MPLKVYHPKGRAPILVFEHGGVSLHAFAVFPGLADQVLRKVAHQLFLALDFMHCNSVIHTDLKPTNILVQEGDGGIHCRVCDFGEAVVDRASWKERWPAEHIRKYGIQVCTLWYRPPDVLLGRADYGTELDVWSLGIVLGDAAQGAPLFRGVQHCWEMLVAVFGILGVAALTTPEYMALPLRMPHFPAFPGTGWAGKVPRMSPRGLDLLASCCQASPGARLTARRALSHLFLREPPEPETAAIAVQGEREWDSLAIPAAGGRGALCVRHGHVGMAVLRWIREDRAFAQRGKRLQCSWDSSRNSDRISKAREKLEIYGHGGRGHRDICPLLHGVSYSSPFPVRRVRAWLRAFQTANVSFFDGLQRGLELELGKPPMQPANGTHLASDHPRDWALCLACLQLLHPAARVGPRGWADAASVLLLGLTCWGDREVRFFLEGDAEVVLPQSDGCVYIGNLTAAEHSVSHPPRPGHLHRILGLTEAKVVAILRSHVPESIRGTLAAVPAHTLQTAQSVVHACLRDADLRMPALADCQEADRDHPWVVRGVSCALSESMIGTWGEVACSRAHVQDVYRR